MWCLCPSDGARCCLARHGASWEKYSTPWRGRRSARSLRTPTAGPCAHVHRDSSEVSGGLGDRISEREERHSDGPLVWERAEFHGLALLGPWIRGVHGGFRVGASPQIHPRTRVRGW